MERGVFLYKEVVPFGVMAFLQLGEVGLSTLFKAATTEGMSYSVFIVYSYAISGFVLLPFAFIFERKKQLPPFNFSVFWRLCLLGFFGFTSQMCGFRGIEYSSPTLGSTISCLAPAFTFVLAIFCRMEKVKLKSPSSRAKIIGTIVSVAGALVVVLYEGPTIIRNSLLSSLVNRQPPMKSSSLQSNWIIGGLLLTLDYVFISSWYIVQIQTVKRYPAEQLLVAIYVLLVATITAPVAYLMEPDSSAWKISSPIMLIAILYAGLFATSFATVLLTWGLRLKGPVYVAAFTPLSIVIAAVMSVIFLGDALHLGCVVGGLIISVGFYVVMWGTAKEDMAEELQANSSLESGSTINTPLLN